MNENLINKVTGRLADEFYFEKLIAVMMNKKPTNASKYNVLTH
jgi:hypothetical protein